MSAGVLPLLNLRRHEIATMLNLDISVVDQLIRTGELPSFKIGGTRLARYEDVKAYNDSQAPKSLVEPKGANDASAADAPQAHPSDAYGAEAKTVIPMRSPGRRKWGAK